MLFGLPLLAVSDMFLKQFTTFLYFKSRSSIMRSRPNAFSPRAVVSSSSFQSSLAGAKILEAGGNIADAAIATSAALCVTQNNLCGLGGDAFALLQLNGKPLFDLNGSGRAFESASIDHYLAKGLKAIPPRGPEAVVTVPGLVRAWEDLHKNSCTMEAKDLLSFAYTLAHDGFPVTQNYSESIAISSRYLSEYKGWRNTFTPEGRIPEPGTIFRQRDLASTIRILMDEGFSTFYEGSLADKIVKGLNIEEVPISDSDLRKHKSTFQEPLSTEFREFTVYETAPNSQAATAILWLNLLEDLKENSTLSSVIATGILAYSMRDMYITDPETQPLPPDFTSKEFSRKLQLGHPEQEPIGSGSTDRGDTTYFSITDSESNSISFIQSNYMGYGSGIVPEGTGLVLQNRGSYFSLDPDHHNSLKAGKRTFHTLCAGMIRSDDGFLASFGSMGGDIQPQLHMQLILRLIDNPSDPQSTLDAPRWAFPYTIYEKPGKIICESEELKEALEKGLPGRKVVNEGFSSQFGHAQITALLSSGTVVGGSDPRGDGISLPVVR